MAKQSTYSKIVETFNQKSTMKQDVYDNTVQSFKLMKRTAKALVKKLNADPTLKDKRVVIEYTDRSNFEFGIRVSTDLLIFAMHTNVFTFDDGHLMNKSSYVKKDKTRSYCGIIHIYNFLNDSFKYNRLADLGYLIGRMYVNKENHFFLEGKRQLGILFNDFVHETISKEAVQEVIESAILNCLNFDLYTPPFNSIRELSVQEMQSSNENILAKTGKRLGFRFQSDTDEVE